MPEAAGAVALEIGVLKHVAVAVVHRVQDDQVHRHFVSAVSVLGDEGVRARVAHLKSCHDVEGR